MSGLKKKCIRIKYEEPLFRCVIPANQQHTKMQSSLAEYTPHTHTHCCTANITRSCHCPQTYRLFKHNKETKTDGLIEAEVCSFRTREEMWSQRNTLPNSLFKTTDFIKQDKYINFNFLFWLQSRETGQECNSEWEWNQTFRSVFGKMFVQRTRRILCVCSYVLLEDEAGQQGSGLFNRQVIEEAVKHHLCQQELVTAEGKKKKEKEKITESIL